jgi:hypothetical protein
MDNYLQGRTCVSFLNRHKFLSIPSTTFILSTKSIKNLPPIARNASTVLKFLTLAVTAPEKERRELAERWWQFCISIAADLF